MCGPYFSPYATSPSSIQRRRSSVFTETAYGEHYLGSVVSYDGGADSDI